jgi:hypothetical protein
MKRPLFRSPDFWKSALMTLPDNSFFELLRSMVGNIKTPFNKQRLLTDVAALLSRGEIQKTIAAYIDEGDARVIAAVAALGEPAPGELESFFAGDLSYAALHDILLNLEERFILYRFREAGASRLALNPVLEPALAPFAADVSRLFPSAPEEAPAPPPVLDDRLLGGILSFIAGDGLFFKNGGGIRKKSLDAGALVFPGLDLELAAGGFQVLALIRAEGEGFALDDRRLAAFAGLSRRERLEYTAAGAYWFRAGGGSFAAGHLFRGRVRSLAVFIHRFMNLMQPDRRYPPETLKRYGNILEREESFRGLAEGERVSFDALFDIMERFGLLVSRALPRGGRGAKASSRCWGAGSFSTPAVGEGASPALAMDSPFSCVLYPGIAFEDVLALAAFLTVREAGVVVRFELTRESAVRGFDRGLDAAGMIALLERLSARRIGENLAWSLKDWEKRYGEVNLRRGIVLTLSEDRRYLAEAEPVAGLIRETLAPGVYLLSGSEIPEAEEALRKAGVDIIARRTAVAPGDRAAHAPAGSETSAAFPALEKPSPFPGRKEPVPAEGGRKAAGERSAPGEDPAGGGPGVSAGALKKRFHAALAKLSLSKGERDELTARINRRLILNESQLEGASIRYEKLEARLLDYVGKAAVAKQAISSKSPVEVTWPHPRRGLSRITGIPSALEKEGGESVLVLTPLSPETDGGEEPLRIPGEAIRIPGESLWVPGEPIRIPLGKISLLRRIKKSIFGE